MVDFPGVAPLLFKGGTPAEYEIIKASTGVLMTRHIASGATRLSVRSAGPLKVSSEAISRLPGSFPGGAEALRGLSRKFVRNVPGDSKTWGAVAGITMVAAAGYLAYEVWRERQETSQRRSEEARTTRDSGSPIDFRAVVEEGDDVDTRWRMVAEAWAQLDEASANNRAVAETLLGRTRAFIEVLAREISGDQPGRVAAAPYVFLARIAAAQAWAVLGEPELAVGELRALHSTLTEIGHEEFMNLRLLDQRSHDPDVAILWGLHAQTAAYLTQVEDGTLDLATVTVPVPASPELADLGDLSAAEGLALDLPIPIQSVEDLVAVRKVGADLADLANPRIPTVRSALSSLGRADADSLTTPIAQDVLMAVLSDEQGGMGAPRADFGLTEELAYSERPAKLVRVELDWNQVIDREMREVDAQVAQGRTPDAAARLETLLVYLDELVQVSHPEIYRDHADAVRRRLSEIRDLA